MLAMRAWKLIAVLTAGHYVATLALMIFAFAAGMSRFDSGEPSAGFFERAAETGHAILSVPLVRALRTSAPSGLWGMFGGHPVFVLNSLLWAVAIFVLVRGYRRMRAS